MLTHQTASLLRQRLYSSSRRVPYLFSRYLLLIPQLLSVGPQTRKMAHILVRFTLTALPTTQRTLRRSLRLLSIAMQLVQISTQACSESQALHSVTLWLRALYLQVLRQIQSTTQWSTTLLTASKTSHRLRSQLLPLQTIRAMLLPPQTLQRMAIYSYARTSQVFSMAVRSRHAQRVSLALTAAI